MAIDPSRRRQDSYGPMQAPAYLGIPQWKFQAAVHHGLIPKPTHGRWPARVIETAARRLDDILDAVGNQHPIGATRAAQRLAERTGLDIEADDLATLTARRLLVVVDDYKGHDLFDVLDLDRVASRHTAVLRQIVGERQHWQQHSVPVSQARRRLCMAYWELNDAIRRTGITLGPFRRIAKDDLPLLGNPDCVGPDGDGRPLWPIEAAEVLGVQLWEFARQTALGWITPAQTRHHTLADGSTVEVPLYSRTHLERLRRRRERRRNHPTR